MERSVTWLNDSHLSGDATGKSIYHDDSSCASVLGDARGPGSDVERAHRPGVRGRGHAHPARHVEGQQHRHPE